MTWHHVAALLLAATLFIVCEVSGRCSEKVIDHASQLAQIIAVATFAHAQGARNTTQRRQEQPDMQAGDSNPGRTTR